MVGLAPVSVTANPRSPVKFLMPVADQIERMLSMTGNSEFGSNDGFLSDLKSSLCGQVSLQYNDVWLVGTESVFRFLSTIHSRKMSLSAQYLTTYFSQCPVSTLPR